LFDTLLSPNSYDRAQARRVLLERGSAILPDLQTWQDHHTEDAARLQALWLRQALGAVDASLLRQLLVAGDGRIRAAAVRVLSEWADRIPGAQDWLAERVADEHPRVRLEAVRALAHVPTAAAAATALRALDKPMDRFLDYGLWLTVNDLADPWLAALESGSLSPDGDTRGLEFGLRAVEPDKAARVLGKLLARHPLTRDGRGPWVELIGQAGGPAELRQLLDRVVTDGFDEAATARALTALAEAARLRQVRPSGDLQSFAKLLDHPSEPIRAAAVRLAGRWHLSEAGPRVLQLAADKTTPAALRAAAVEALGDLRGPEVVKGLRGIADDTAEVPAVRRQAALALLGVAPAEAIPPLRELLAATTTEPDAGALWRSVLGVQNAGPRLAVALRDQPVPAAAAVIGLRVARESFGRQQPDLVRVLTRQAGDTAPRAYSAADVQRMAALAELSGDAARGELIYRRPELRCVACHAIGGAGGKVGPDLTSAGAGAPIDYLVESVYLPDKAIKEGFHAVQLQTAAGRVHTGILVRESPHEVVLRDANGQEIAVPRKSIVERSTGGSLMPAGLVDHLFDGEQRDLFRFLAELGKPGPFDAARNQAARLWRIVAVPSAEPPAAEQARRGDDKLAGWTPLTTTVAGGLVRQEVRALLPADANGERAVYAATRFEVPRAGKIALSFGTAPPAEVWVDGQSVAAAKDMSLDLAGGVHTLVLRLDPGAMPERLYLRSSDVVFRAE
jgi:putative heme-binding domain-containing protein